MITTKEMPLYPIFKSGQNLTHDDLNNLRNYLSHQTRLTRTHLIGTGIFYGFEVSLLEGNSVKISKGVGVTSNGHLISLNEAVYTKFKQDEISLEIFLCEKDIEELQEIKTFEVIELYEGDNEDSLDQDELEGQSEIFNDKVVVLLYEETERIREQCIHTADENGKDGEVFVKKILISVTDALIISKFTANKNVYHEFLDPFIERLGFGDRTSDEPSEKGIWLENLDTYAKFNQSYREVCMNAAGRITKGYENAALFFDVILGETFTIENLKKKLEDFLISTSTDLEGALSLQYIYSYFRDLIDAYRELTHLDIFQSFSGFPDECRFHNHLNLGGLVPVVEAEAQSSRTPFLKVPLPETGYSGLEEARFIMEKMKALLDKANLNLPVKLNDEIKIKITASKSPLYPLSERAIPYYYNNTLRNKWNFKLNDKQKNNAIPSYNSSAVSPFQQPLLYDLGSWDFYRVEGHIGLELKDVLPIIKEERKRLNVPFDIVVLKIEEESGEPEILAGNFSDLQLMYRKVREDILCKLDEPNSLGFFSETLQEFNLSEEFENAYNEVFNEDHPRDCNFQLLKELVEQYHERLDRLQDIQIFHHFAQEHPGLEHMGGVYSGGTLILLIREERFFEGRIPHTKSLLIADFCLPYTCCSKAPKIVHEIREIIPPVASFSEKQRAYNYEREEDKCVLVGQKIRFENTSVNATRYEWLVNGDTAKSTASKEDFVYDFHFAEDKTEFSVRLVAFNEGLTDEATETVTICPESVKLIFEGFDEENTIELDNKDGGFIEFKAEPPGGEFSLTEVAENEGEGGNGDLLNQIREINGEEDDCAKVSYLLDYGELLGRYILTYKANQQCPQSISVDILVEDSRPVASFEEESREYIYEEEDQNGRTQCILKGQKVRFLNKSKNATRYEWFVEERKIKETEDLNEVFEFDFLFDEKNEFEVKLIAYNNGLENESIEGVDICPANISFEFEGHEGTENVEFEKNQENQVKLFVEPAGGTFRLVDSEGVQTKDTFIEQQYGEGCSDILYTFNYSELLGNYSIIYGIGSCGERTIRLEIINEDDVLFSPQASLPEGAMSVLNKRTAETRDGVQQLGEEDHSITTIKSYKRSLLFVDNPGNNIEDIHSNFKDAFQLLARNLSTTNEKRKDQYTHLALSIIRIYLDRVVALNPAAVPEAAKENISHVTDQFKKAEIDINTVKESWDPDALKESLKADSLDQLNKLIQ